jgi:hypothetical protein
LDAGSEQKLIRQLKESSGDRGLIALTHYDLLLEKAPSFAIAVRSKLKDVEGLLEAENAPACAANLIMKMQDASKGRRQKGKFDSQVSELLAFVAGIDPKKYASLLKLLSLNAS